MPENAGAKNWLLGAAGGIAGGALGYFAFSFLVGQGLYAMVLPGALVGLGCGYLSGMKSQVLGGMCGLAALALGVFIEWKFFPFAKDDSFGFFVAHLQDLKLMTLVMIGIGGFAGYWFGRGRS